MVAISEVDVRVHAVYSFPHVLGAPGIGTTALHQVRGLIKAGVEVTVICTSTAVPVPGAEILQTLRLAGRRIPHRAFLSVQRAYDYHDAVTARHLRRHRSAADIVHVWPRACLRTLAAATSEGCRRT